MANTVNALEVAGKVRRSQKEISRQLRKTKMCTYYLKGACPFAEECAFAHTFGELKAQPNLSKTRLCKFWMKGACVDEQCNFAHGPEELNPAEHAHQVLGGEGLGGKQQRQVSPASSNEWGSVPARVPAKPANVAAPAMPIYVNLLPSPPPTVLDRKAFKVTTPPLSMQEPLHVMSPTTKVQGQKKDQDAADMILKGQYLMDAKILQSKLMQSTWSVMPASEPLVHVHLPVSAERASGMEEQQLAVGVQVLAHTLRELTTRCHRLSYQLGMAAGGSQPKVAFLPPGLSELPPQRVA
mmetsp:Transcript_70940/g.185989  ORF Transcript_70940/g.185989 Transcript_70940/m.185989 type:complete len:296 (+) Transcript_70940:96-983(+)